MKPYWKTAISYAFVFGMMVVGFSPAAHAAPMLKLTSGLDVITIEDGSPGDTNALPGVVGFAGVVGSFTTSASTGFTKPTTGAADAPKLFLTSIETSSVGGTLTIEFTDTDFFTPDGVVAVASIGGTTYGAVSVMAYRDTGNVAFGKSELLTSVGPFSPVPFDGAASNHAAAAGAPYALTLVVQTTHPAGAVNTSFGASLDILPNPEPGTMMLFGTGLLGMLGYGWRRQKQAA